MSTVKTASAGAGQGLLYLSDEAVRRCGVPVDAVTGAIARAFAQKHQGGATTGRQLHMPAGEGLDFKAKGGVLLADGYAAVKWYGFSRANADIGLPRFIPLILLNRLPTGEPVALLDGHWISAVRTAGISVAAATVLADPAAETVGFIASGVQARSHLDALRARFPLKRVRAYSPSGQGAVGLVAYARELGLEAEVAEHPRDAVVGQQIIVSSVPRLSEHTGFLDTAWLSEGAFVAMPDSGRAWSATCGRGFDVVVTDDLDPRTREPLDNLNYRGLIAGELSEVLSDPAYGRLPAAARRGIAFAGSGLADAAIAALVYEAALAAGLGMRLPA